MQRPHWQEWWGEPAEELGYVRAMIEGRDSTEPYFFFVDGICTGYIQMWYIKDALVEPWLTKAPWLNEVPERAVGVDLSISDEARLSRGLGSIVLSRFVSDLRARGFDIIIIDPDPNNGRAIRAYTKAGFRPIPELEGCKGGSLIMQHMETIQ
jgi:aminoglycoside 6'-N-acetyltransferase